MRLLFWSELFWPYVGGTEHLSGALLPALRSRGHEFFVVTSHQALDLPDREQRHGVEIHRLPLLAALKSRSLDAIAALRRETGALLARIAPDIIHVSSVGSTAYLAPVWSGPGGRIALVAHLHSEVLPSQAAEPHSLLRRVLQRANHVVAVSAAVRAQAVHLVPEIAPRSSVILNGVDEPRTPPSELPFDPPCLLCLGRLVPEKGFDVALRVFRRVGERIPTARFVVAGDGRERARLQEDARVLGLGDRVRFLGAVPPSDVPALINSATLLLMPSRREGLPLVAIEAAYMGRPVVAVRTSGLPEVVVDGETGLLTAPEDAEGLARAALAILEDPLRARRMGTVARQRAREVFSIAECAARFDELYRTLAPAGRPAVTLTASE